MFLGFLPSKNTGAHNRLSTGFHIHFMLESSVADVWCMVLDISAQRGYLKNGLLHV